MVDFQLYIRFMKILTHYKTKTTNIKPHFSYRVQSKSPSFASSPTAMYSEALNASLQSALGFSENNLPFFAGGGNHGSGIGGSGGDSLHASLQAHYHREQRDREEKQMNEHHNER